MPDPVHENEQLKLQLKQREAELAILTGVQLRLADRLEVQAIYDLVGDQIRTIFDPDVVMLSTYDPLTNTVEHRYAIEMGQRIYAPGHLPPGGFRSQVVEKRAAAGEHQRGRTGRTAQSADDRRDGDAQVMARRSDDGGRPGDRHPESPERHSGERFH